MLRILNSIGSWCDRQLSASGRTHFLNLDQNEEREEEVCGGIRKIVDLAVDEHDDDDDVRHEDGVAPLEHEPE